MPAVRLGRKGVKHVAARRLLAHDLFAHLPHPPLRIDHTNGHVDWGMMENDVLGLCTCAGLAHSLQLATLATGGIETPPDAVVVQAYRDFCGYDPADPTTDQGGFESDVLSDVQRMTFAGHKLLGWASPDPRNLDQVRKAVAYFNSVYIGAAMPLSAQVNGPAHVWKVVDGKDGIAGGWGGHCMVAGHYSPLGMEFITWGTNQPATWEWYLAYVDEVHVLLWDCQLKMFPAAQQGTILKMLQSLGH